MGKRGKKRVRADGSQASSKHSGGTGIPRLLASLLETPLASVSPDQLALALTISNRHYPITTSPETLDEDDEAHEILLAAFNELTRSVGIDLAYVVDARAQMLRDFLHSGGDGFYTVDEDGTVKVRSDLLTFAASTPLIDHPDKRLDWSPVE